MGVRGDGVLLLRTIAAPIDGKANAACIELLAEFFAIGWGQITLLSGATGRDKRFSLDGITQAVADERLQPGQV